MPRCTGGRHLPAFILLFLAQEPAYGLTILDKLRSCVPHNRADSAGVYRALQELEKADAVESYWDTSEPGPAKKWYRITPTGFGKLAEHQSEIQQRKQNLDYFLEKYTQLSKNGVIQGGETR